MKGLAVFITSLFVNISVSAQTGVETDSVDTSAFDRNLDEIVIVAKKPGTIAKTDRKVYTVNQDLASKAMMTGKTRADALSQLSAANIERIEVIDNPTSEYRAEGGGGIINIKMRTNTKQGFNGSILANAGSAGRYNAGVNLNYGIRNLNFYGGYTFRRDRYDRTVDDYRISPADTLELRRLRQETAS